MIKQTEVIVIGSGFGGAVSASRLAEAGISVKLLERGPWRDSLPNASMNIKNRVPFPTEGRHFWSKVLRTLRNNKLPGGRLTINKKGFYEVVVGKGLNILCSSNVGGGSHAYSGLNMPPPMPGYWDNVANGLSDNMMTRHYDSVMERMGANVPDDHITHSIRKRFSTSDVIQSNAEVGDMNMGYLFARDPGNPQEVVDDNGIRRREATPGEEGNLGSPGGGKTPLEVAYLVQAIKQGLQVCDLQEVLAIRKEPDASEARYCVKVENHHTGQFESHYANHVIVAAGTVNTLHLLLHSREGDKGLGGMPNLGQRFGSNGDFFGYWDHQDKLHDLSKSEGVNGFVRLTEDEGAAEGSIPMILETPLPNPDKLRLPGWIAKKLRQGTFIAGMGPDAQDGTVSLVKGKLKIDYQPENSPIFAAIRQQMDRIAKASGKRVLSIKRPTTAHPTGGACIGQNLSEGVVNEQGEVFDHPGLYVADAAALPKPVGGPPSMTIAAWADHVAARLIDKIQNETINNFGQETLLSQQLNKKEPVFY